MGVSAALVFASTFWLSAVICSRKQHRVSPHGRVDLCSTAHVLAHAPASVPTKQRWVHSLVVSARALDGFSGCSSDVTSHSWRLNFAHVIIMALPLSLLCVCRLGRRLWNCQGWCRNCKHGYHAPHRSDEEHRASYHGRYFGYLRTHCCRHLGWKDSGPHCCREQVLVVCWLFTFGRWVGLRSLLPCSRYGNELTRPNYTPHAIRTRRAV